MTSFQVWGVTQEQLCEWGCSEARHGSPTQRTLPSLVTSGLWNTESIWGASAAGTGVQVRTIVLHGAVQLAFRAKRF